MAPSARPAAPLPCDDPGYSRRNSISGCSQSTDRRVRFLTDESMPGPVVAALRDRGTIDTDFGVPVKILNDAAMQAVGSYKSGKMLFLGLGTGLGSCFIVGNQILPMELAHLPYKNDKSFEDYVGLRGLERLGKKKWRKSVADVIEILTAALIPDEVVLGGGNAANLKELPVGCRLGDNANAFEGGFRVWEKAWENAVPLYHDATPPAKS
jgi:predicted NBD/HSP70 family sugar kinase